MSLLPREILLERIDEVDLDRRLVVTPLLDRKQVGPGSVDLRLGTDFLLLRRVRGAGVDPASAASIEGESHEHVTVGLGDAIWLHPQQFVLGATLEFLRIPPDLGAYVVGRSSWGRIGLIVATAIMVQPGYAGSLTLELVNEGDAPIRLYPGLRIAQLAVHSLTAPTEPYTRKGAKYLAPTGPQASRAAWDKSEVRTLKRLGRRFL
jgi:dCTP deaminase